MTANKPDSIDAYIANYPAHVQVLLKQMRDTINKCAPQATELISYGMPAFKQNGLLCWFAAHTNHIGFYPKASGISKFKKELSKYKSAQGSVQFPFNNPLPLQLITKIVKFRLIENEQKSAQKKGRTKNTKSE